jgi:hypothetical protein
VWNDKEPWLEAIKMNDGGNQIGNLTIIINDHIQRFAAALTDPL